MGGQSAAEWAEEFGVGPRRSRGHSRHCQKTGAEGQQGDLLQTQLYYQDSARDSSEYIFFDCMHICYMDP